MKQGFTIVEMLVAISILVIGVLGPLGVASRGISDGIYAKNQIAATYLAQEAMEVVINTRNSNLLLHRDWLTGLIDDGTDPDSLPTSNDCSGPNGCYVDAFRPDDVVDGDNNSGLIDNSTGVGDSHHELQFCADNNIARYLVGSDSCVTRVGPVFTRAIFLDTNLPNEVKITVTVDWFNKNAPKSIQLIQHLYHLDDQT